MTPTEVWEACRELECEVGPRAEVSAYVSKFQRGAWLVIRPLPYPNDQTISTGGCETWEAAFAAARALWTEHSDRHAENNIKAMALAIVRITYKLGECSEETLRAEFDVADVARYADRACDRANAMAERGPFTVIRAPGANDVAEAA